MAVKTAYSNVKVKCLVMQGVALVKVEQFVGILHLF
jgi:hypothetical protein